MFDAMTPLTSMASKATLLGMNESERQALAAALAVARRDRQELDQLIGYLSRRLGVPDTDEGAASSNQVGPTPPDVIPSSLVADGEFFGMSATKATRALLNKLGRTRPLKTREIFDAITKGGVKLSSIEVLYKSLGRSNDFQLVQKGTWGLSEWYGPRSRRASRRDEEPDVGDEDDESPEETADSVGVQT